MATKRVTLLNDGRGKASQLRRRGRAHTISYTANTTRIEAEGVVYMCSENPLPVKWLHFIKEVRDYATSLDPDKYPKVKHNPGSVAYFRFKNIYQKEYRDVMEIDVNGAYWQIALKSGYINDYLYGKGLEAPKKVRLVALGALATRRKVFRYCPQSETYQHLPQQYTEAQDRIRSYFFDVAATLGEIMSTVSGVYNGVLFFWVDAFFTQQSEAQNIVSALRAHDLEVKFKEIEKIIVKPRASGARMVLCHMKERDFMGDQIVKPFTIPGPKNMQTHIAKHLEIVNANR